MRCIKTRASKPADEKRSSSEMDQAFATQSGEGISCFKLKGVFVEVPKANKRGI
jgi:hypothetical protein